MNRILIPLVIVCAVSAAPSQPLLPGFQRSPDGNEQIVAFIFESDVRIHLNSPGRIDPSRPSQLIIYALPNGNTIEQTVGKQLRDGDDWHYNIQHIGAQVRRLRELIPERNFIVAYLEAASKSWPAWRRNHADAGPLILRIVDTLLHMTAPLHPSIVLTGHSGGGSFTFGYLNAVDSVSPFVERIAFLDSNYGYDDSLSHGTKLLSWLAGGARRVLSVLAYDDRWITLNGKRVVGPDGGTFRATGRMEARFRQSADLQERRDSVFNVLTGLGGRIDFRVHRNPDTLILHTVLVERNGFLHSILVGTPSFERCDTLWGVQRYRSWILP